tara:strand:- start:187 stop:639 length:453 start_codon:yes stop_codon:yes gene_type:complete
MSSKLEITKKLKVLGIISQGQLSNKMNLDYWWQRKYREVQLSRNKNRQDKLILINQAKDSLDKYDINYLKNIFKDTKRFRNQNQKFKTSRNKKITSNYSESSNKNRDSYEKSTYNSRKSNSNNWDTESWWFIPLSYIAYKFIKEVIINNS